MREQQARWSRPQSVAVGSLGIDVLMVGAKLAVGLLTGSLALISDAAHSGLDMMASGLAFLAVRAAAKPADREHPYGHGRAENLSAFCEGIVLLIAAVVIAYEGIRRLLGGESFVRATTYAIALPIATMAIETARATVLYKVSRAWGSPALAAAAQNRIADIFSALAVLVGLVGVRMGYQRADAVAALVVAVVIARAALTLAWRSGDVLMDRAPRGVEEDVERVIAGVPGVNEVRSVRVRRSGSRLLGDARVSARRLLSVEGADALSETIKDAVRTRHPQLDLTLVVEPQPRAEHMVERVHAVAERLEAIKDLHNVNVEVEENGSLHLSMHAKLPGAITLDEASRATEDLERRLRQEFPGVGRIDIHLEPLEPDLVRGHDVTARREDLAREVRRIVEAHPSVRRVRDVELSARGSRIIGHVVAEMEGGTSLEEAHRVQTELEDRIRQGLPDLYEVVARVVP